MRISRAILTVAILGLFATPVMAADAVAPVAPAPATPVTAPALTDAQKAAVEDVVRELLTKKEPEIVIKAAQEMQKRQEVDASIKSTAALTSSHDKIFNDVNSPIVGNPKGDVTVVEFFDYNCGYCKMGQEAIQKLLTEDKNVKLIYKEFPILGPTSVQASKAALASVKQNKYQKFHDALLGTKDHLTDDLIFKIAKDSGLDVEKLKKDMADDSIDKMIQANVALGGEVGARGTPTFIIGEQVYPGAVQYEQMKQMVDDVRKANKK